MLLGIVMDWLPPQISKNNFWNGVILFGVPIGIELAEFFRSAFLFLMFVVVLPLAVALFINTCELTKDGKFIDKYGRDITAKARWSGLAFLALILSMFTAGWSSEILEFLGFSSNIRDSIFIFSIILIPMLIFIINDIPLSMWFCRDPNIDYSKKRSSSSNSYGSLYSDFNAPYTTRHRDTFKRH